jgi:hypothetical protein
MVSNISDPIGAVWLMSVFNIKPAFRFAVVSGISTRRKTEIEKETGFRQEWYPESYRPTDTVAAHLQFHLRNEIVQLEFLQRLFERLDSLIIQDWIDAEPTGQYARRIAFLYEWLTDKHLRVPDNIGGNYVDALSDKWLVTSSPKTVEKNSRWRVNDNLAGNRDFCPTIIKTAQLNQAASLDVAQLLVNLTDEFGEDLLMRSSVWLTLRESKGSFKIEGEGKHTSRIARFADVTTHQTGKGDLPINGHASGILQHAILGDSVMISQYGLRQSPVFVGQTHRFQEIVHYIAPPHAMLANKLAGLQAFWEKTIGQSSVMRASVLAFGFVYIHPLADGNGRVHRFLFNDILRRDGVLPESVILPISSVIAESSSEQQRYAQLLDDVSKPLMASVQDHYYFDKQHQLYADGIRSNLVFDGEKQANPIWSYPDLTKHIIYLAQLIEQVVNHDMREELLYLLHHEKAREAIKEIMEMPNDYADRLIRSVRQNEGKLTNKLVSEFGFLENNDEIWKALVEAVSQAFES